MYPFDCFSGFVPRTFGTFRATELDCTRFNRVVTSQVPCGVILYHFCSCDAFKNDFRLRNMLARPCMLLLPILGAAFGEQTATRYLPRESANSTSGEFFDIFETVESKEESLCAAFAK